MKILHVVGGSFENGAFKGAYILHKNLKELGIESKILNNGLKNKNDINNEILEDIIFINDSLIKKFFGYFLLIFEKFLKFIFLPSPRSTFTFSIFGQDITKLKIYKESDIIHIHWLDQNFIRISSLSKIKKPIVWTMRDMWPFTGGSHYTMDFEKYEKSLLSKTIKNLKKKNYPKHINFIAISNWLQLEAKKSFVLNNYDIKKIYNNIDLRDFDLLTKTEARLEIKISTSKKVILYGAQNPQSQRKGWDIFKETLRKLDKSKYFLLIFGNFWSRKDLDKIGIEYKSFGFVNNIKILNKIYCSSDIFIFPSLQEAFGKTWAEAFTCGIPIVCFKKTSPSEIIEHKVDGYIVNQINSEQLKEGIEWVSNNLVNNQEKKIINKKTFIFDARNIAFQYLKIYKKIIF